MGEQQILVGGRKTELGGRKIDPHPLQGQIIW